MSGNVDVSQAACVMAGNSADDKARAALAGALPAFTSPSG